MSVNRTFYAASIPRYLRSSRLAHLPLDAVIGSWMIENKTGHNQYFDVVMLPAIPFSRMRHYLSDGHTTGLDYSRGGGLMAGYSLQDVRRFDVPQHIPDPAAFAAAEMGRAYGLDVQRTVYAGAPRVAASLRQRQPSSLKVAAALTQPRRDVITLEHEPSVIIVSPLAKALAGLHSLNPERRRDRLFFAETAAPAGFRPKSRLSQLQA